MIAIYAGSFDPFTNGHLHIIKQAADIFGYVRVVIATNQDKKRRYDPEQIKDVMRRVIRNNDIHNVSIEHQPNVFIADYAHERGVNYLVRGLRNDMDYQYEESIAKVNKEIYPELKTIYLRADNEIISSSFVTMMFNNGKDIGRYVPWEVLEYMRKVKDNGQS